MFSRRSTSPPPSMLSSTAHPDNSAPKPFNDWKRRVGQKTLLKLGLTENIKDENTGNFDACVDRFHANATKVATMKAESEGFCSHFRVFLQLGFDNMTFLADSELDNLYDDMATNQVAPVIEYILYNEIERPVEYLNSKSVEIEQLIKHRNQGITINI